MINKQKQLNNNKRKQILESDLCLLNDIYIYIIDFMFTEKGNNCL